MGFNTPGFSPGPSPDDWAGLEARRAEREQRATANPNGREISGRSRRAVGWVLALAAMAMVAYAILGWLGILSVPGFNA